MQGNPNTTTASLKVLPTPNKQPLAKLKHQSLNTLYAWWRYALNNIGKEWRRRNDIGRLWDCLKLTESGKFYQPVATMLKANLKFS